MNENRVKLVKLLAIVNAVMVVDDVIPDEEIDRVFGMKYTDLTAEVLKDKEISEGITFGEMIDMLLKEFDEI